MNNRIKKLRKTLELTQQEFADKISVKRNTVATYEMGRSEPSDAAISLICREFNVNENWLRNNEEPMFIQKSKKDELAQYIEKFLSNETNSFKERLVSTLIRLNDSDWEVLEKIAIKIFNDKTNNKNNELSATNENSTTTKELNKIPTYSKSAYEMTDEEINEEVEAYRQQLIFEKKQTEKSSASQKDEMA